jgi:hypothetical protein
MDTDSTIDSGQIFDSDEYVKIHLFGYRFGYDLTAGPPKGRFKQLCEKYNDTWYNQAILAPWAYEASADEFTAIEVVSDLDWDADHPAGTSLADIITFLGSSPYRFIQSGYADVYDWANAPDEYLMLDLGYGPGSWPIEKRLTELTREDLTLLDTKFILRFDTMPTLEQEHNLTLTMLSDEKTLGSIVKVAF